jgi:uncharacterized membrane protein YheB (UPF0754 family)
LFFYMQIVITITMMVVIGAIIGGVTNALAIKMLFRPYNTLYIGKWKVPFTPGLIPKRRDELAEQMGKIVVNHLLTPESIQRKFLNDDFQKEMTAVVQKEIDHFLHSEATVEELLEKIGIKDAQERSEARLNEIVEEKYESIMETYRNKPLKAVIPEHMVEKVNGKIPEISSFILQKGINYFASMEGKMRIQRMADDFLKERSGVLGGMLQMFMGNIDISDKIQPEIIKFLKNEGTAEIITTLIKAEWEKVLEWETVKIEEQMKKEEIVSFLKGSVQKVVKLEKIFGTPISELSAPYQREIAEAFVPNGIQVFGNWLSARIDQLLERLRLQEVVRDQVASFSLERLEEMVLSISKRELKMITFLGALLGGFIGLFQGFLALLMN